MDKSLHALRRLTIGFDRADVDKLRHLGLEEFIQEQLNPVSSEPAKLLAELSSLATLSLQTPQLFREYGPPLRQRLKGVEGGDAQRLRKNFKLPEREAGSAKLLRAVYSPHQLQEVLVDFWFNHFNVFIERGFVRFWGGAYERDAIRPFVFGKFRDMLFATARHPAMLTYLDNWQNTAPESAFGQRKRKGINENYARELLELHTLGVDGGYGQRDVRELARILTGWGLRNPGSEDGPSVFFFNPKRHDMGEKLLLGRRVPGGGQQEVEDTLAFLADHPSTARHIATKLVRHFVADIPPGALVEKLARRFRETDGDLRAVLAHLFASAEFWDERYYGTKFKTPFQYLVSCLRLLEVPVTDTQALQALLRQWGMPIYGCPTPDGYRDTEEAWLNPDALMRRIDYVNNVTHAMSPAKGAASLDADKLRQALGGLFSRQTLAAVDAAPQALRLTMLLASPEFLRR